MSRVGKAYCSQLSLGWRICHDVEQKNGAVNEHARACRKTDRLSRRHHDNSSVLRQMKAGDVAY